MCVRKWRFKSEGRSKHLPQKSQGSSFLFVFVLRLLLLLLFVSIELVVSALEGLSVSSVFIIGLLLLLLLLLLFSQSSPDDEMPESSDEMDDTQVIRSSKRWFGVLGSDFGDRDDKVSGDEG